VRFLHPVLSAGCVFCIPLFFCGNICSALARRLFGGLIPPARRALSFGGSALARRRRLPASLPAVGGQAGVQPLVSWRQKGNYSKST